VTVFGWSLVKDHCGRPLVDPNPRSCVHDLPWRAHSLRLPLSLHKEAPVVLHGRGRTSQLRAALRPHLVPLGPTGPIPRRPPSIFQPLRLESLVSCMKKQFTPSSSSLLIRIPCSSTTPFDHNRTHCLPRRCVTFRSVVTTALLVSTVVPHLIA
jgi:hypothetical protein